MAINDVFIVLKIHISPRSSLSRRDRSIRFNLFVFTLSPRPPFQIIRVSGACALRRLIFGGGDAPRIGEKAFHGRREQTDGVTDINNRNTHTQARCLRYVTRDDDDDTADSEQVK